MNLAALPKSGPAYTRVKALADKTASLNLLDNTGPGNDVLLANAIFGDCSAVRSMLSGAANRNATNAPAPMGPARNIVAWVTAANLCGDHSDDAYWRSLRDRVWDFGKLECPGLSCKANNHGMAADQSLVALDLHLNDRAHLESKVLPSVMQRLGVPQGLPYRFGDACQAPGLPAVVIGRPNTFCDNVNLDGLLLEEQRRASPFPNCGNYNWGASGQLLLSTYMLDTAGYAGVDTANARAFYRVFERLDRLGCAPDGDDAWQGNMYDYFAGVNLLPKAVGDGKSMCCTDYLWP